MEAYFPRKALAAQKGLHTCCFNCLQYQGFPIECKCWVQKTLTCQPSLPALRTQSGCNTCFVLLRMLYGTYSSAKLKIISAAAFQIIGLGKLSRNEFLLLGWIYCSIRIMMVLYSTSIRQLQEMLWEHLLKAESCTCHEIIWVLQRQSLHIILTIC